jgi:hypothetical protein
VRASVAVFGQGAQGSDGLVDHRSVEPGRGVRGDVDRQCVGPVGLAAVSG